MPNPSTGTLYWSDQGPVARITIGKGKRESYPLPTCKTEPEAETRKALLANMANQFRKAGIIETPDARELLKQAAACPAGMLASVKQVAGELLGGELIDRDAPPCPTFREVRKQWTSGELHKLYPDHVKAKDSDLDLSRAEKMEAIDVGGIEFGDMPIDSVTIDHCEQVMRKLPDDAKRPATRRGYGQVLSRVLALAVYPLRHIAASPLPKNFLPKSGKAPAFAWLYPAEDAILMAHTETPLAWRVFFGWCHREGPRAEEGMLYRVRDFDLERGVCSIDVNKTGDARSWRMDPGSTEALKRWVALRGAEPDDLMFVDPDGNPITSDHRLAELLRASLWAAGVRRPELHSDGKNRRKLRLHDLRAGFATTALANGRNEAWVCDRTGWRSSQMLAKYRRAARLAEQLDLGPLTALSAALPDLPPAGPMVAEPPAPSPEPPINAAPLGADEPIFAADEPISSGSTGTRTQDQRIKKASNPRELSGDREKQGAHSAEGRRAETADGASLADETDPGDPVEIALADAITRASVAGQWTTVEVLARELEGRRKARSGVVSLEAARARRGGK